MIGWRLYHRRVSVLIIAEGLLALCACSSVTDPADGSQPAMSPVLVAAIDESQGPTAVKNGLYTIMPDASGLRELWSETASGYTTLVAAWAPDRKRVAFAQPGRSPATLRIVDTQTGEILTHQAPIFQISYVRWHPDNQRVAISDCPTCPIQFMEAATGASGYGFYGLESVDWTRDGSQVTFVSPDLAGVTQVNVMRTDGSGRRTLTDGTETAFLPRWSPDGTTILFRTPRGLWIVPVTGDTARQIAPASGVIPEFYGTPAAWSPDGRHVAFTRVGNLTIARADGTDQRRIQTPGWISALDW